MLRRSLLLLALLAASAFETTDAKKAKAAKPVTKDSAGFSDEELEEAMEEVLHSPSPPTVNLTDTRRPGTYDELVPAGERMLITDATWSGSECIGPGSNGYNQPLPGQLAAEHI